MFSDSFPAMALAFESEAGDAAPGAMRLRDRLFDREMKFFILIIGALTSVLLFALYALFLGLQFDPELVRTFIFASFGTYTLFLIFSVRNLRASIFEYSIFSNTFLVIGVCIGFTLMALAIYLPPLQTLLDTVPLPPLWLLGVVGVGVFNIFAIEVGKFLLRKRIIV
jgi:Ca2+-transporting ATPase